VCAHHGQFPPKAIAAGTFILTPPTSHGQATSSHLGLSQLDPWVRVDTPVLMLPFSLARRRRCSPTVDGRGRSRLHPWPRGHGSPQPTLQVHTDAPRSREAGQPFHRRRRLLLARGWPLHTASSVCFPRRRGRRPVPPLSLSLSVCMIGGPNRVAGPAYQLKRWLVWVYNRVRIANLGLRGFCYFSFQNFVTHCKIHILSFRNRKIANVDFWKP
jgi:hypothetical protein